MVFKKGHTMTNQANQTHQESTYQLLVESEDKERGALEDLVYFLLVVATALTIWQFGHQPVTFADLGDANVQKVAALL